MKVESYLLNGQSALRATGQFREHDWKEGRVPARRPDAQAGPPTVLTCWPSSHTPLPPEHLEAESSNPHLQEKSRELPFTPRGGLAQDAQGLLLPLLVPKPQNLASQAAWPDEASMSTCPRFSVVLLPSSRCTKHKSKGLGLHSAIVLGKREVENIL